MAQVKSMVRDTKTLPGSDYRIRISRHRGVLTALVTLAVLIAIVVGVSSNPLGYYDVSQIITSGTTISIAAMGQTLVILSGGFDLSAAATISLVNVSLASLPLGMITSPLALVLFGILLGGVVGAVNGLLVAYLKLQPIVVTLATMFILQGVTLLIMDVPGGLIDGSLAALFSADIIPGFLPMSGALILLCLGLWAWLKGTPFGLALYAAGGDAENAHSAGLRTERTVFLAYVLAGGAYGLAGVCISAQTGAGDPLVGNPMLLQIFAAVVVGGTVLGGGRGGLAGSVVGAFVLILIVNILLILNVSAYFSTIAESLILLFAVLLAAIHRRSVLADNVGRLVTRYAAWRAGLLASQLDLRSSPPLARNHAPDRPPSRPSFARHFQMNRSAIMLALPAYAATALVVLTTQLMIGNTLLNGTYYNTVLVLSSFLAILALGQGCVILTGGLDLSLPWIIALAGIVVSSLSAGVDSALIYAVPVVLVMGSFIGLLNGAGVVFLGLSPIVMTLAMNGLLQGTSLLYSNGTPDGFAAPLLRLFMTYRLLGITPVVVFFAFFVVVAILLTVRTPFGRRIYAIGNSPRAAVLSGVNVKWTIVCVYMLSGFCAALVGVLLSGLSGQASLGMGDEYLLPSIAAVVVGGTLVTGGRGNYAGMLGGVLLLTALQTLLAGTTLPNSVRSIVYGVVILGAVVALRQRRQ